MAGLLLLLGVALLAPAQAPPAGSVRTIVKRAHFVGPEARGISGLTFGPGGRLFAIPERERHLLSFAVNSTAAISQVPIEDAPLGADLESIAWLGGKEFALGIESLVPGRKSDPVLFATLEQKELKITSRLEFDYTAFDLRGLTNAGLEGLCVAEGILLIGSETVGERDGKRFAPFAARHLAQKHWSTYRVWLTTTTGKIASLACRVARDPTQLEVLAIERHYADSRIIRFTIPRALSSRPRAPIDVVPELYADLTALVGRPVPNFEGIEWVAEDEVLILSDNDQGFIDGPMVILRIR